MMRVAHAEHRTLFPRLFITLMMLAGWFVLSNHCALVSLHGEPQQSETHHCHAATAAPTDGATSGGMLMECCYSLDVAVPDAAKPVPPPAETFALLPLVWVLMSPVATEADAAPFMATSPPEGLLSFSELVLQRCLPSLAPPRA